MVLTLGHQETDMMANGFKARSQERALISFLMATHTMEAIWKESLRELASIPGQVEASMKGSLLKD
jgi:hypothetical protein